VPTGHRAKSSRRQFGLSRIPQGCLEHFGRTSLSLMVTTETHSMTRRWTTCCFAIFFSMAVPASTFAYDRVDDEARTVTAGCPEVLKRTGQLETFETGMCLGILKGLHYLSKDICIPPATSLSQMGDVVARYFDGHADKIRDDFRETAIDAMRTAWPCGRKNNI
jgi:hypothetical protein